MKLIFENVLVKKASQGKGENPKTYVTVGDKDAIKEFDFSVNECSVKAGFEGAVSLSGADVIFMRSGGYITGASLDALAVAKK